MGRVIVGVVLGAILGGIIGWLPNYGGATFNLAVEAQGKMVTHTVSLANVISHISILVGTASGGIIGAIAGATSANPNIKPVPRRFWIVLGVLVVLMVLLMAWWWLRPAPTQAPRPQLSPIPDGPAPGPPQAPQPQPQPVPQPGGPAPGPPQAP